MNLREFFGQVASQYDRHLPMSAPAQILLRHADEHLGAHVPGGLIVKGSGGGGVATSTPWVGVFDPDETTSPQTGVYVVYLFTTDMQKLALSLNQGITELANERRFAAARGQLAKDAKAIRDALPPQSLSGLADTLNLNPAGEKFYLENQKAYAAANIAALEYASDALPDEAVLREDMHRFLELYQDAIAAKRQLLQADPGSIGSASAMQTTAAADPLVQFKPKNDGDYVANIKGRTLVKTRRHETVVNQYSQWVRGQGFQPATPHPRDLSCGETIRSG